MKQYEVTLVNRETSTVSHLLVDALSIVAVSTKVLRKLKNKYRISKIEIKKEY